MNPANPSSPISPPGLRLSELAALGVPGRLVGEDVRVVGVKRDSRDVSPGDLFVAVPGEHVDGASFAEDAVARGAAAILAESELSLGVPVWVTENVLRALPLAAEHVYGRPLAALRAVGITGTNGKSTCVHLLEQVLVAAGGRPAMVGTGYLRAPGIDRASLFTTPYGDDLARFARDAVGASATHLLMEVSSHALALHRADAVPFEVAGFTNLTQDHLDFHPSMEAYGEAKARLFLELAPGTSVVNVDDLFGAELAARIPGRVLRTSAKGDSSADLHVLRHRSERSGIEAELVIHGERHRLTSPLVGAHNLENLMLVLGCALALGVSAEQALGALATTPGAPGRLERVPHPGDVTVLVDYAHTPDALQRALDAVRPITKGRLWVVFGCGGDRDRHKRPKMGRIAAGGADLVVVTSDNPRTETPSSILAQVESGVADAGSARLAPSALTAASSGYAVVEDRAEAIRVAVRGARAGDTVLIAGKGHETYQIVGTERLPFDDVQVARDLFEEAD